jgi:excisionase family DNA binding protein
LLDKRGLAHTLAVSTATVDRLCREGRVPYVVVGDSRRFDLEAVRDALANSTASPAPTSPPSATPPPAARPHTVRLLSRSRST